MYLKALNIHGFKSFADKTVFEFHEGVTGIVGPNGCGKSNVVDAIRWVLGETSAKALRGGEMADVIFNGTDSRKPVGLAEVSLVLADCEGALRVDFNELEIGRRVYRDGHSEYLLNRKPCRLRDVQDLLMDTGIGRTSYSIMEQGKIDLLLSSKPEDRRMVFEEAAGITKFKAQKKEALRKLDYTEANLLRLADIVAEVKRQMGSLQRQAAKARRYQSLLTDLKILDSHLSKTRYDELKAERAELETSIHSLRNQQADLEKQIEGKRAEISGSRDEYQRLESAISGMRQEISGYQNRIQTAENRIGFNEERSGELRTLIEQNTRDIETTERKLGQQELDLKVADESVASVEGKVRSYRSELEQCLARHQELQEQLRQMRAELRDLHEKSSRAESESATVTAQLDHCRTQRDADQKRRDQLDEEIARLCQDREEKRSEHDQFTAEILEHRRTIELHEKERIAAEKELENARGNLEKLQSDLRESHRALAERESRLKVLEQLVANGEGFQKGTREVIQGLGQPERFLPGVFGVLANHVGVDAEFAPAIEAALGRHLQAVLVADSSLAEEIIATLTRGKRGEASLIAEDFIPVSAQGPLFPVPQGAVAWAIDKIRVHEKLRPLLQRILANVLIVPDIRTGLALRDQLGEGLACATLQGEFISPVGMLHGGAGTEDKGSVLQRQNEIHDLREQTAQLRSRLETGEEEAAGVDRDVKQRQLNLDVTRDRLQHARVNHSTVEGKSQLVEREAQQIDSKIESQEWELQELQKRYDSTEATTAELRRRRDASARSLEEYGGRVLQLQHSLEDIEKSEGESEQRVNDLRTALAVEERTLQNLREQRLPMTARMQELVELIERRKSEIESHSRRVADGLAENNTLSIEIEKNRGIVASLEEEMRTLTEQRTRRARAIEETEAELVSSQRHLAHVNEQRGNEEIKTTQLDLRLENLSNIIQQRYQINLETFDPDPHSLLVAIENQKKIRNRSQRRRDSAGDDGGPVEISEAHDDAEEPEAGPHTETEPDSTLDLPGETGPDWAFVKEIVSELKQRFESMGPVNLDAIEEFEELEERHSFLEGQHRDLVNSKEELLRVIAKINKTTRQMFAETFEQVRKNFQSVFGELFGKGSRADLILLDETDPLECGIDIVAKPPGKKLQSISLLSGGERSMTAVAMLFAIYMVKPSPFCVLDELDAPLDEANIGRFLKVLDRFIQQSQFVIITHNKRTMSRADVMYGVTMEEYGVSKRVGMKLTAAGKEEPAEAS